MQKSDRDYFATVSAAVFFTFFFFGSDYLELPNWSKYILCGIGGVIGYFSGAIFKRMSSTVKVLIFVLFAILITVAVAYWYADNGKGMEGRLLGSWVTDDSGDFVIKFRITASNELYISRSPDYVERLYEYRLNSDSLVVYKEKEVVFNWRVVMPDSARVILIDNGETLTFRRASE